MEPVSGAPGGAGNDEGVAKALEALRQADRDRYLCALAASEERRADLVTLYAFNAELAGIADKVSEQMLGLIRLQWWRDAVGEIAAGRSHRHHLVQGLAEIASRRSLSFDLLQAMINARERDVDNLQPATLDELEAHAAATAGALCEAALEICVDAPSSTARQAARDAGTAYGLVGILRATPYLARHRRILLPVAEMQGAGLATDQLLELKPGPAIVPVTRLIAERARELLAAVRRSKPPRNAIPALFPARLAAAQLERLRTHSYDPFAPQVSAPSGLDIWRLVLARWSGRI